MEARTICAFIIIADTFARFLLYFLGLHPPLSMTEKMTDLTDEVCFVHSSLSLIFNYLYRKFLTNDIEVTVMNERRNEC